MCNPDLDETLRLVRSVARQRGMPEAEADWRKVLEERRQKTGPFNTQMERMLAAWEALNGRKHTLDV
jgi:hypothetical protein